MYVRGTAIERLIARVETAERGCWVPEGARRGAMGYSTVGITRNGVSRHQYGHVVSYRHHKGEIPDGHVVRHTCDNPPCINPDHLITGTHAENSRDMVDRKRNNPHLRGKRCTPELARVIKDEYASSEISQTALAAKHGLSLQMVNHIINGRRYKHA